MTLPPPLVALSPGTLVDPDDRADFLARVDAALEGGLRAILFREPLLDDRAWGDTFAELRERLDAVAGSWLGAHDRVHLGLAGRADAVHLGFRSLPPECVRGLVPADVAIGLSTHAADERGPWSRADYLFHGPVHATPSKAGLQDPIGFEGLARAVSEAPVPVLGLGGLGPGDARAIRDCGAHGMAVLSAILLAADPAQAARAHLRELAR